jgi:hypothetical protein
MADRWTSEGSAAEPAFVRAGIPKIPRDRPPDSRDRTAIAVAVANWIAEKGIPVAQAIAETSWLYHAVPTITSYLDAPKSLEQLQEDAFTPLAGYDLHHIVEQTSAEQDGYSRKRIDAPDNLVRIPRIKHWQINAWYQIEQKAYGGLSPRDYLRGKDWDERRRVGLYALKRFGVLQ